MPAPQSTQEKDAVAPGPEVSGRGAAGSSLMTRPIDNFVVKLRYKLEALPHRPEHILTVHGEGYKFVG